MDRRTFLCGLPLGAVSLPRLVQAQQPGKMHTLGILSRNLAPTPEQFAASPLVSRLRELGWIEGKNLIIVGADPFLTSRREQLVAVFGRWVTPDQADADLVRIARLN